MLFTGLEVKLVETQNQTVRYGLDRFRSLLVRLLFDDVDVPDDVSALI